MLKRQISTQDNVVRFILTWVKIAEDVLKDGRKQP
jgi:hypothetical protein